MTQKVGIKVCSLPDRNWKGRLWEEIVLKNGRIWEGKNIMLKKDGKKKRYLAFILSELMNSNPHLFKIIILGQISDSDKKSNSQVFCLRENWHFLLSLAVFILRLVHHKKLIISFWKTSTDNSTCETEGDRQM